MDCPILVWMLFTNREMTKEEYAKCHAVLRECVPHAPVRNAPNEPETMRQLVAYLLPLLMMRHRRVPRNRWRDQMSNVGKHWIEQAHDNPVAAASRARSMIGYHTSYDHNLVGMAMTQGRREDVVNIGVGIKELTAPPGMSANDFAISLYHKLTPTEQAFIAPEQGEEIVMRRLCLLLALKQAYIKAIGQPMGFDWSRLEFNIPEKIATGDGRPLAGWEFRVWTAELGWPIPDSEEHTEQKYQCAVAFFRRTRDTRFIWQNDAKELESWVQFITLDQLLNVADKLVE
ncbi:uncharacterized protein TRAVEDRAFT_124422 [Trametes versicolor FP-101664 SS1]|uniref:uncharacterized protein n=1 Tax=Trametes versicolor (strain FP-101664) TaxID=717944 RepID=UPI0004621C93|nr:uncharacterized protein TRAVEDRAFT_124422 [Trametes versicolor FP-101664 SS1]EIW58284.1 hypothetical protein TRAVEDRAFT_124422 [Trametes versicolor FP-101664 SS1]